MTTTQLPKIIQFLETTDAGEYGATCCPHCDAKGRYVHHFLVEGGARRAAMSGCIKLFPVSPVALAHKKIMEKAAKLPEGRKLNGWDTKKLEAIEAYYAGTTAEADALIVIQSEDAACARWVAKKYGGRR